MHLTSFIDLASQNNEVILMGMFCLGCTLYICSAEGSDLSRRLPKMMHWPCSKLCINIMFSAVRLSSKFLLSTKTISL